MNKSTEKRELGSEGGPTWTESTHTVSEAEAARLLGVKRNTLRAWRARHKGPRYLKFSWKVRYRQSDVEKFVADSVVDPAERHQLKLVQRRRSGRAA